MGRQQNASKKWEQFKPNIKKRLRAWRTRSQSCQSYDIHTSSSCMAVKGKKTNKQKNMLSYPLLLFFCMVVKAAERQRNQSFHLTYLFDTEGGCVLPWGNVASNWFTLSNSILSVVPDPPQYYLYRGNTCKKKWASLFSRKREEKNTHTHSPCEKKIH